MARENICPTQPQTAGVAPSTQTPGGNLRYIGARYRLLLLAMISLFPATTVSACGFGASSRDSQTIQTKTQLQPDGSGFATDATLFHVEADVCTGGRRRASGFAVGRDLVLTVAHTFSDASEVRVFSNGRRVEAELIALEQTADMALFRLAKPVTYSRLEAPRSGENVAVLSSPERAGRQETRATVRNVEPVTISDGQPRESVELNVVVQPGESGAPVINDKGHATAMVYAASKTSTLSWATTSAEIEAFLAVTAEQETPVLLAC